MRNLPVFTGWMRRGIKGVAWGCISMTVFGASNTLGQEHRVVRKAGPAVVVATYTDIPAATEQCTPEECGWWKRLRESGNNLLRNADKKSLGKYVSLFVEGFEGAYRIPLGDRSSQLLVNSRPSWPMKGVIPKNGKVELLLEVRGDGSVGEIKVAKSLRSDMDLLCVQSQRQSIYLPAIKSRAFVAEWQKAACSFWSRKGV